MLTKKLLLTLSLFLFTTLSFAQEIAEDTVVILSLTDYDYRLEKVVHPMPGDRRATFNRSLAYPNLQEFINAHIQFPDDARLIGAAGPVIAQFEILGDGSLGEIYFVQSPDQLLSDEVERVLRLLPRFIPAVKNGRMTSSYEQVKVNFQLR